MHRFFIFGGRGAGGGEHGIEDTRYGIDTVDKMIIEDIHDCVAKAQSPVVSTKHEEGGSQ